MFKIGSKDPEPYMRGILQALVPVLNSVPNRINLTGHTDSLPYANGELGYSNWELSSDRANATRRMLVASGLADNKFLRVIGTANMLHLENIKPDDPLNRRISVLVLSKSKEKTIMSEDNVLQNAADTPSSEKIQSGLKAMSTISGKATPPAGAESGSTTRG